MKLASALLASLAISATAFAAAGDVLLHDDFSGSSIDSSTWQVILPFAESSVTVGDGSAVSTSRGTLATNASFTSPYTVTGNFSNNDYNGFFSVILRSDLESVPVYGARTGVTVDFSNPGATSTISITALDADGSATTIASVYFYYPQGDFTITDDGTNISVALNGTEILSGSTSFATGDQIAFTSREWSGSSVTLNSITITAGAASAVPEPSSFAALAGLGALGLVALRRRRAA